MGKYIDLETSCSTQKEKEKLMDMLNRYKETFRLRNEIDTCPNIEEKIDVFDKIPIFIRAYNVKEEDKQILDKEMKRLCHLGILEEGFLYTSVQLC